MFELTNGFLKIEFHSCFLPGNVPKGAKHGLRHTLFHRPGRKPGKKHFETIQQRIQVKTCSLISPRFHVYLDHKPHEFIILQEEWFIFEVDLFVIEWLLCLKTKNNSQRTNSRPKPGEANHYSCGKKIASRKARWLCRPCEHD